MKGLRGDLLITLGAHLLTKPLWLIIDNLIQDRLGHEVYGLIGALHSFALWANVIADWSFSYYITRQVAQTPHRLRAIAGETLLPKLFLATLTWGAFLLLGYLIGYARENLWWLAGLLAYQVALSLIQYFRSFFQGAQLFRADALLGNAEKMVIVFLILSVWGHISGDLYVGVLASGGGIALIGIAAWAWWQFGPWHPQMEIAFTATLLRRLMPYTLLVLVSGLNERINQVLIERLSGPYENGLYLGAYRWFGASLMYLWIVLPIFYARFASLGHRPTRNLWRTFLMGQLTAAVPLLSVTLVMFVEPDVFLVLFRHSTATELSKMASILQILSLAGTLSAVFNIYSTHITANHREGVSLGITGLSLAANLVWSWWGIPRYGATAGGIGLLVSYGIFSLGHYVFFQRWVGLPRPVGTLPWMLLSVWLGTGLSLHLLRPYVPPLPKGLWGAVAVSAFGMTLYLLGTLHLWRRVSRL
jgi:O-antigen/teichoic acid export membrane protein